MQQCGFVNMIRMSLLRLCGNKWLYNRRVTSAFWA